MDKRKVNDFAVRYLTFELWEQIEEFRKNNKNEKSVLDVIDFLAIYYPTILEDPKSYSYIGYAYKLWSFLKEEEEKYNREYTPTDPEMNDLTDYDDRLDKNTEQLLYSFNEWLKEKEKDWITYYINKEDENPLYDGKEEWKTITKFIIKSVAPFDNIKKSFVYKNTTMGTSMYLVSDFAAKTNYIYLALKGNNKEYNMQLLKDYADLCRLILKDKYIWDNEIVEIKDFIKFPEVIKIIPNAADYKDRIIDKEKRSLREGLGYEDSLYNLYCNYKYTKNEKDLNLFLNVALMSVDEYKEIEDNEEAAKEYVSKFIKKYNSIRKENEELLKEMNDLAQRYDLYAYKKDIKDIVLTFTQKEDIKHLEEEKIGEYIFVKNLEDSTYFKTDNDRDLRDFLIEWYKWFRNYNFDKFKSNSSFEFFTEGLEELNKRECPLPSDFDFSHFQEYLEMYSIDDQAKLLYTKIVNNKIRLKTLTNTLFVINLLLEDIGMEDLNDEYSLDEIFNYVFGKKSVITKQNRKKEKEREENFNKQEILQNIYKWCKPDLLDLKKPQDYIDYLDKKNKEINNRYENKYEEVFVKFIEEEIESLNEQVKNWKEYNPEKVKEKTISYLESIKDNIKMLYGNKWKEKDYQDINEQVIKFLTTGETMYESFKIINIGDYGGIALNYHKALEFLLNTIFWKPYKLNVLDNPKIDLEKCLGNSKNYLIYNKSNKIKTSVELGNLTYFLKNIDNGQKYEEVVKFYKNINIEKFKDFFNDVGKITRWRNECAHPEITNLKRLKDTRNKLYEKEEVEALTELIFRIKDVFQ